MFTTPRFRSALLAMGIVAATSVPLSTSAQSRGAQAVDSPQPPLQLFVTLPVKRDHLDRFLATMHREVAGARSEAGNVAFDVYEDANRPGTLYLFEHWANAAVLKAHTGQPYYQAIRAQEPDDLAGAVDERKLKEVPPAQGAMPRDRLAGQGVVRWIEVAEAAGLVQWFADTAPGMRAAAGNQGFALYQDEDRPREFLLIERWADAAARDAGRALQSALRPLPGAVVREAPLADRSLAPR